MCSRLKGHNHPSSSVHQTPSHIQVLCQHDLQSKSKVLIKRTVHMKRDDKGFGSSRNINIMMD